MAIQTQLRRGTTAENNAFTGAIGELVYDTQLKQLRIHDGTKLAGFKVISEDSSGNVGIGVVPATWQSTRKVLQLGGNASIYSLAAVSSSNYLGLTVNAVRDGSSWKYVSTGVASRYEQSAGKHNFTVATSGTAGAAISFADALTLDNSGNAAFAGNVSLESALPILTLKDTNNTGTSAAGWIAMKDSANTTIANFGLLSSTNSNLTADVVTSSALFEINTTDSGGTQRNCIVAGGATPKVSLYYDGAVTSQTVSGGFQVVAKGGLGYGTGAGGAATQATSKTTSVTLNASTGKITMNNAALASGASVAFTFSNSSVSGSDVVILNVASGFTNAKNYNVWIIPGANSSIVVKNISTGSLSEALVINFAVIKGATT